MTGFDDLSDACLRDGQCAGLSFSADGYSQKGEVRYVVRAEKAMTVALNESHYDGWLASLCTGKSACVEVETLAGPGQSTQIAIPAGESTLRLQYHAPLRGESLVLGAVALALAALSLFIPRRAGEPSAERADRAMDAGRVTASPPTHD